MIGRPDIAWPAMKIAVFVDGAFWHGHPSRHTPGRSGAYWDQKIAANVERDIRVTAALRDAGWIVLRVWDFQVQGDLARTVDDIGAVLARRLEGRRAAAWHCQVVDAYASLLAAEGTVRGCNTDGNPPSG